MEIRDELPPPESVISWAQQAMQKKDWSEAARRWSVLRKAYPEHAPIWFQGFNALLEAGEIDRAEALLRHAQKIFPKHLNVGLGFASIAMRNQDYERATELIQQAKSEYPDKFQTWIRAAELAELMGDSEQASECFLRAAELAPNQPWPLIQYAEVAMRSVDWNEALNRWNQVRERFPEHPAGYFRAAEAARRQGLVKLARNLKLEFEYGPLIDKADKDAERFRRPRSASAIRHMTTLIWSKSVLNLRSEVQRHRLSYGWWIIEPLLHMAVYYLVFGKLLQYGGESYPAFLLVGLVPWMWFMKSIGNSSNSILVGQDLMLQVGMSSIFFPLVNITQAAIKQIPVFVLLLGFVWIQGYEPGVHWLALVPIVLVQALLTVAVGLAVAALIPFARDLSYLVPTGLTFLMFISGVFFDYRNIPYEWQSIFLFNPVAFLIDCYRLALIEKISPDLVVLMSWGAGSALACLAMFFWYRKLRYVFPRIVLE